MSHTTQKRISVKTPTKTKADEVLEESFYKELAGQAERLDNFALGLIKLQLAIPALYAGILKLLDVKEVDITTTTVKTISIVPDVSNLLFIFTPWFVALCLSFLALFPMKHYDVKTNPIIEPLPDKPKGAIAINAYLHFSALRKFRLLVISSFLTFLGIAVAVFGSFL
ncbi:MAG: hypothetical protein ABJV04_01530 [Aliiglaciecola sp.]|uniref:hypothetical protein n=1 Tax=Aliiglaciecola sp. TaxID=1872441 RepID=UPI003297D9A9